MDEEDDKEEEEGDIDGCIILYIFMIDFSIIFLPLYTRCLLFIITIQIIIKFSGTNRGEEGA